MRPAVIVACAALATATVEPAAASARDPKPLVRETVEKEILRAAGRLRTAILEIDAAGIEALVSPHGIHCTDDRISRACVQRDLRDPTSRLYARLFDSAALKTRHADAGVTRSWRDAFRAHPDDEVLVHFDVIPRQDPYAHPCAEFVAGDEEPAMSICFYREAGRWWITGSLYECW